MALTFHLNAVNADESFIRKQKLKMIQSDKKTISAVHHPLCVPNDLYDVLLKQRIY